MLFLAKPLKDYFNRVPNKDAFFAPKRLKTAFAAGVIAYGATAGCAYKMYEEISQQETWHATDLLSYNAVYKGGIWGTAGVLLSYVGDAALLYSGAGYLYRRRNPAPSTP